MGCDLSIIVPIFNAQNYIRRTIQSLLTQQLTHYEVIMVDDGSTDQSSYICQNIADQYSNVKYFRTDNLGPGHARNCGIKHASGEYIAFCDSDDLPSPNMYGLLTDDLRRHKVDYSLCDIFSERDDRAFGFPWSGNIKLKDDDIILKLMSSMLGNLSDNDSTRPIWGSSVRCIYRHDLITEFNITFPENIRFAEDLVFNIRYIRRIKSCFVRNEALYRYTFNRESLMNSHTRYNKNAFKEHLELVRYILDEISHIKYKDELLARFTTIQRCYFLECVGNAARSIKSKGYRYALKEISSIVKHPVVCNAFNQFDAKQIKKRLSYSLIKTQCVRFLLIYFAIRQK